MNNHNSLPNGCVILLLMICHSASAQNSNNELFQLQRKVDKILTVNEQFNGDSLLHPFTSETSIYGLAISGDIQLKSESSLVRVILMDNQYHEYLVYEAYPLLTDVMLFTNDERCEETCRLNSMAPQLLEIEIMVALNILKKSLWVKIRLTTSKWLYTVYCLSKRPKSLTNFDLPFDLMTIKKLFISVCFAFFIAQCVLGDPIRYMPFQIIQPDGDWTMKNIHTGLVL